MNHLVINFAYLFYAWGLAEVRVVRLRLLLLLSNICFLSFSLISKDPALIFWNVVYIIINGYQTSREIIRRYYYPLSFDEETLHTGFFKDLSRYELAKLMSLSKKNHAQGLTKILQEGRRHKKIFWLQRGLADVLHEGKRVTSVGNEAWLGEAALWDESACRDVSLADDSVYWSWDIESLRLLFESEPNVKKWFNSSIQSMMIDKVTKTWN